MTDGDLVVCEPDEAASERVVELGRDVFHPLYRRAIERTDHMLCARLDGEIAGGLIMEVHSTSTERVGIVSWLFTAEEARGHGVGTRLVAEGLSYLRAHGCAHVVTDIEGHNTSSSTLFARAGFEQTTSTRLVRHVGLRNTLTTWRELVYYTDFGHFLWYGRLGDPEPPSEPPSGDTERRRSGVGFGSLFRSWSLNLAVLALAFVGLSGVFQASIPVAELVTVVGVGVVVFLVRETPIAVLAGFDSEPWRYRGWLNGVPMSVGVGLVFGAFFPMLGSLYPRSSEWTYREKRRLFGIGATVSTGLLTVLLVATQPLELAPVDGVPIASVAPFVIVPFLVVDHLLFFTPFRCYRGGRVYDWNRTVWLVLTVAIVTALVTIR